MMENLTQPPASAPADTALSNLWMRNASGAEDFFGGSWRSFSNVTMESQKILGDTIAMELQVIQTALDRLNGSYMNLLGCRQVQELPAAWASLSATCCDLAAAQAKAGSTVADRLRNCYAGLAKAENGKSDG